MKGQVPCECPHCDCEMDLNEALEVNGHFFCGEACANGHVDQAGCGHAECGCGMVEMDESEEFDW